MSTYLHSTILVIISLHLIPIEDVAANSSISTMRLPNDMEPIGSIDNIIYSFLGSDKVILNEYIQIMSDILSADIFREHLKFLSQIKLKCLPKVYSRLKKVTPNDFSHCQHLHSNLINIFGNRILEACKNSDSFTKCLKNARKSLSDDYDNVEEDILELYLNEVVGGKDTCMGDIIRQLKIFSDLVQKECK